MYHLISYDITNNKLRRRIMLLLKHKGCVRLQYSVWLTPHYGAKKRAAFKAMLDTLLLRYTDLGMVSDSILCVPIEGDAVADIVWLGSRQPLNTLLKPKLLHWV
jgi:CRISPR-associated endonuclease Cas2